MSMLVELLKVITVVFKFDKTIKYGGRAYAGDCSLCKWIL